MSGDASLLPSNKGKYMQNGKILVKDYPCGSGKTSSMISSLSLDKKYLIVVPLLSEVERIIDESDVPFHQPNSDKNSQHRTKYESLETLLLEGKNIVTTHQLYSAIVSLAREGLLSDYHIIIDEVHERDKDIDFLLLLSRKFLTSNSPGCKIILMSATLNPEKLCSYYSWPL